MPAPPRWTILREIVLPLCKSGIALGSIFVVTQVMGDFFVVKVMSGGQSASVVSALQNEIAALQYPPGGGECRGPGDRRGDDGLRHPARRRCAQGTRELKDRLMQTTASDRRPWTFYALTLCFLAVPGVPVRADAGDLRPVLSGTGGRPDLPDAGRLDPLVPRTDRTTDAAATSPGPSHARWNWPPWSPSSRC